MALAESGGADNRLLSLSASASARIWPSHLSQLSQLIERTNHTGRTSRVLIIVCLSMGTKPALTVELLPTPDGP